MPGAKISQEIFLWRTPRSIGVEELLVLQEWLQGLPQTAYLPETQDLHQ